MQFRLADLFVFIALCAVLFGLAYWFGILLAAIVATVPFCVVVERLFEKRMHEQDLACSSTNDVRRTVAIVCALGTPILAQLAVSTGVPGLLSPFPLLSILPWFFELHFVAGGLMVGAFLLYSWPITRSPRGPLPIRATMLLIVTSASSVVWFVASWPYGMEHQGLHHTVTLTTMNAVILSALWLIWSQCHRNGTFAARMTFTTMLFYWLFWFALPWLGELP